MDKKKLLLYSEISAELRGLELSLERLENDVYRVSSGFGRVRREKNTPSDFTALLVKLLELKKLYEAKWDTLINARTEIEADIEGLPHMYRAIIRYKYIEGLNWDDVADKIGYSVRQAIRIHNGIFAAQSERTS